MKWPRSDGGAAGRGLNRLKPNVGGTGEAIKHHLAPIEHAKGVELVKKSSLSGYGLLCVRGTLARLVIASGADVKVAQKRLRHASAMTTLNTYDHMWPDADESARAAVGVVLAARADSLARHSCGLTAD